MTPNDPTESTSPTPSPVFIPPTAPHGFQLPPWFIPDGQPIMDGPVPRQHGTVEVMTSLSSAERVVAWRDAKSYQMKKGLATLRHSIASQGFQGDLKVYLGANKGMVHGGTRRLAVLKDLIRSKHLKFPQDYRVTVWLYYTTNPTEIVKQASIDNAHRVDFDDAEKMRAFEDAAKSDLTPQVIGELNGVSKETVQRYLNIAEVEFLRQYLTDGVLPYSKLSEIAKLHIEAKDDAERTNIQNTMGVWKDKAEESLAKWKDNEKKNGRDAVGARASLAGWLPNTTYKAWLDAFKKGEKPPTVVSRKAIEAKVNVNEINIEGFKMTLKNLTPADIRSIKDTAAAYKLTGEKMMKLVGVLKASAESAESESSDVRNDAEYKKLMAEMGETISDPAPAPVASAPAPDPNQVSSGDENDGDLIDLGESDSESSDDEESESSSS